MINVVAMAVFFKDGKVLLEKRKQTEDNYAGLWAFPGGHRDEEETIGDALKREMKEELNVEVIKYTALGEFTSIDPTSKDEYHHSAFLCTEWEGEITETAEEEGIRWVELDKVHELENVSEPTSLILKEVKKVV